jgi:hypothetical protein
MQIFRFCILYAATLTSCRKFVLFSNVDVVILLHFLRVQTCVSQHMTTFCGALVGGSASRFGSVSIDFCFFQGSLQGTRVVNKSEAKWSAVLDKMVVASIFNNMISSVTMTSAGCTFISQIVAAQFQFTARPNKTRDDKTLGHKANTALTRFNHYLFKFSVVASRTFTTR